MPAMRAGEEPSVISAPICAKRSWLCPTEADVQRFYDAAEAINRIRTRIVLILCAAAVVMTPWLDVVQLALVAGCGALGIVAERLVRSRVARTVLGVLIALSFQVMLLVGVASTGGLNSPLLCWLVVPVTTLAVRYRPAVVAVAVIITLVTGGAACILADVLNSSGEFPALIRGVAAAGLLLALATIALNLQTAEIDARRAAASDPLTGLPNRKALELRLARVTEQAAVTGSWLTVAVCDLDHFKAINDTYGHGVGDQVLKRTAEVLAANLRPHDHAFRVGGEEFMVLLPDTGPRDGLLIAERLRAALAEDPRAAVPVTMSVGLAWAAGTSVDERRLIEAADKALYTAKNAGRNQVCAASTLAA